LSSVIRAAKNLHYSRLISNSNNKVKATWSIIKSISGRKNNKDGIQFLNIDGKLSDNHHMIVDSLNKYFLTIADKTSNAMNGHTTGFDPAKHLKYMSLTLVNPFPKINFKHTTSKEAESIIKSFKPKNSNSNDEIWVKIPKIRAPFISSPSLYIYNRSLSTGVFPTRLKYSVIEPLLKNGDKSNMSNYRLISLMTSFSKVFEKGYLYKTSPSYYE
jgi:Notch-like protein